MPNTYCWGDRLIPRKILSQSDSEVTVQVINPVFDKKYRLVEYEESTQTQPIEKVVGWAKDGDRIQCLVTGGDWVFGAIVGMEKDGLAIEFDRGGRFVVPRMSKNIRVLGSGNAGRS